jgi:predicted dithiol-disulfide oxidoreductase (DUF899 family)
MTTMENLPEVVTREEWLAARKELLGKEKELTRARIRLNTERRRLFHDGNNYLDLTALGRQEPWEEPKDRATPLGLHVGGPNMRLPDDYDDA